MSTGARLPGTVAEVAASEPGPRIGAFFDFDGTLIAGYSAAHLTQDRLRSRDIGLGEIFRTIGVAVQASAGRAQFEDLLRVGAEAWRGRQHADLIELGERLFREKIADLVYPEARELVRAHQARGHTVVLSSSATTYQVEPIARHLGIEHALCNRFTVGPDGLLTGEIEQPVMWGPAKANVVQQFASEHAVELGASYFYADGDEDVALMYLVGHPRPTNPGKRLARVADQRGWPVLRFASRPRRGLGPTARQLASLAALVPIGGAGAALGLARRDKWAGINFTTARWLDALFAISGVRIEVTGREHLWQQRPAVFIFNHRNNFDALMAARLVERDFTGVAKKELARDPIMGTFGRLADVAFVDRADRASVVETLRAIEELGRKGLSILIAPEGTRVDTSAVDAEPVGPFKKGAFRVAMAAGMPIVPIVFRDADLVAARGASKLTPGTVHAAVLEPISVEGWEPRRLRTHVAAVRQLYLDTLHDWPDGVDGT